MMDRLRYFVEDLKDRFDPDSVKISQLFVRSKRCMDCGEPLKVAKSKRCPSCHGRAAHKIRAKNHKK